MNVNVIVSVIMIVDIVFGLVWKRNAFCFVFVYLFVYLFVFECWNWIFCLYLCCGIGSMYCVMCD